MTEQESVFSSSDPDVSPAAHDAVPSLEQSHIVPKTVSHAGLFQIYSQLFLDFCSGHSSPVSEALSALGADRFEPIDTRFGDHMDLLSDGVFYLVRLRARTLPATVPSRTHHATYRSDWHCMAQKAVNPPSGRKVGKICATTEGRTF